MSDSNLAVLEPQGQAMIPNAAVLMRNATDVAGVCKEIVMRTAMDLKGKKYVRVDGWSAIAAAYGCIPSIREVTEDEHGDIHATAELRRVSDGAILATAEAIVGSDEPVWATRPRYARRGMASTRAISRVCRTAFSFVVVLIDTGLSSTPAEEVPAGGFDDDKPAAVRVINPPKAAAPAAAKPAPPAGRPIPFGKNRGKQLSEINDGDLKWLLEAAIKSVNANAKPEFLESNQAWLAQVEAEASRRVQG